MLPRYEFSCIDSGEIDPYVRSVFLGLRRMIGEDEQPWEPSSPDFSRVKRMLLDAWKFRHSGLEFDRSREGRIVIKPHVILSSSFVNHPVPFILQSIVALACASHTLAPGERTFKLELLDHPATNEVLVQLLKVINLGVPVSELVVDQILMSQLHASVTGTFFMDVLGCQRENGVQRFEFSCRRCDYATVGAVCSALALSQSVKNVAILGFNGNMENDERGPPHATRRSIRWPWLSYALFSPGATHHIESVRLSVGGLTMNDVDTMRQVLSHPNPLAYVCALDEPSTQGPVLSTAPSAVILKPRTRFVIGHRQVIAHAETFVERGVINLTTNIPYQIVKNNSDERISRLSSPARVLVGSTEQM